MKEDEYCCMLLKIHVSCNFECDGRCDCLASYSVLCYKYECNLSMASRDFSMLIFVGKVYEIGLYCHTK